MTSIMTTELLDFEEQWPRWSGRKDEAIRARFGVPPARYFQLLEHAIDTREALEARPILVRRLLRQRAVGGRRNAS
ncbi:hypothetical protein NS220_01960 [Microbacterium testaceum]|uniref:DUF3263 domain-containing protein n=1 Tax=Microbacterium testaceum TaxID=2033 RepID=A0A147F0T5_MICTE|nr:DUF3263 domain-containing protein [Microbacterium testaceum]KTR96464.1 hypothetical protein NS220_01960 [Microbacterium testaceum]